MVLHGLLALRAMLSLMNREPNPTLLDRFFTVALVVKGIDGVIETVGGIILLVVPIARLHGLASAAIYELHEEKHAFVANTVATLDHKLTPNLALFGALYLLIHGLVKLGLVAALLSRRYALYPYAIGVLVLFTVYQAYELGYNPSAGLALLTLFDVLIVILTYVEWRRHTHPTVPAEA